MRKILFVLCFAVATFAHAGEKPKGMLDGPRFDFRGINVAQVVLLIYSEALKDAFVIDPDVLNDQRSVSFRYDPSSGELRAFIMAFFDSLGLAVARKNGVDFVSRKQPAEKAAEVRDVFVYRPRYRDGSYLVDLLSPLFKGEFTARRVVHAAAGDKVRQSAVPPGSAAAMIDRSSDTLVFAGSALEIEMLKKMLFQVDNPTGDVIVRGVLYEVQADKNDGSGFSLALNLLGKKLGVRVGPSVLQGNAITFANATIDAAVSALSTDSRFTVRSTPTIRVASGQSGRFTVGQDVPVLGAVTYTGAAGAPVQSVEYRSSGVIFDLMPVLHDEAVDLTVMQQVSNFVATDTGVNNSPTLIKRELKTSLSLTNGELVVIGGLAEDKETISSNGLPFLPRFMQTKFKERANTEILLILQLTRV
ncbi:MAG: type II secretion system protein GspD [Bacillota bacterium]